MQPNELTHTVLPADLAQSILDRLETTPAEPVKRKRKRRHKTTAQRMRKLKERIAMLEETNRAYAQALENIERIAHNA
ncbi:hypothetical protein [Alloscardovia macacae]|uniref:Uncharacterized protein n=1 Tax=Alloscardovia macacae TaxID=1160091 RepID=A0A261F4N6_9BIFI|nr:hypothetical protein [Alloscardovia macacae]OZG54064.1 hypothetical protein ALMA_1028 [Alloscardovia macacae]